MNNDELKTQIDTDITDKVTSASITPPNVGDNMREVIDLTKPYKELRFLLSISGGTPTVTEEINDFVADGDPTIFTYTVPSNGKLRISPIAPATNPFTAPETTIETTAVFNGGVTYSVVPELNLVIFIDLDFKRQTDGDQSSTPNFSNQRIIIKKYD